MAVTFLTDVSTFCCHVTVCRATVGAYNRFTPTLLSDSLFADVLSREVVCNLNKRFELGEIDVKCLFHKTSFCLKSNAKLRFSSEQVLIVIHITLQKVIDSWNSFSRCENGCGIVW